MPSRAPHAPDIRVDRAEPTGVYYKLLLRIAASPGFETALVDAGHVKTMRSVLFGDDGKTDQRDPPDGCSDMAGSSIASLKAER